MINTISTVAIVALNILALVFGAGAVELVTEMPVPPTNTPLVTDSSGNCQSGVFYLHVYDKAPEDPTAAAFVVCGILAFEDGKEVHRPPFLILQGINNNFTAWLRLPGRGIQKLTTEEIRARYNHPCEIVDQINAAPA